MLSISRNFGERFDLKDSRTGEHIATITLLDPKSHHADARIGIEAPKHILIERDDMKRTPVHSGHAPHPRHTAVERRLEQ